MERFWAGVTPRFFGVALIRATGKQCGSCSEPQLENVAVFGSYKEPDPENHSFFSLHPHLFSH